MPNYFVTHIATGERRGPVYASSAEEACNLKGWDESECKVQELGTSLPDKQPFIPTQDERDLIQKAINQNIEEMTTAELLKLRDTLRRWFEAQSWES